MAVIIGGLDLIPVFEEGGGVDKLPIHNIYRLVRLRELYEESITYPYGAIQHRK